MKDSHLYGSVRKKNIHNSNGNADKRKKRSEYFLLAANIHYWLGGQLSSFVPSQPFPFVQAYNYVFFGNIYTLMKLQREIKT
jgi:hypothetical protein